MKRFHEILLVAHNRGKKKQERMKKKRIKDMM